MSTSFKPFVPESVEMKELTFRALALGLAMTVVLGSANAYLGLRAGHDRRCNLSRRRHQHGGHAIWKGSLLEENIARTSGSIGEGVASGAIFTIPAFLMAHIWKSFGFDDAYWKTSVLIFVGSVLGVLFISLVRRIMVEDPELPFPESVAASEIHKAGHRGAEAAKFLFWNIGIGGGIFILSRLGLFGFDAEFPVQIGQLGTSRVRLGGAGTNNILQTGGISSFSAPSISPAYLGVGYVIGPKLAALQFSGGVLAWGFLVPLLMYFMGPQLRTFLPANADTDSGARWPPQFGDTLSDPSPSAACWWAPATRSLKCAEPGFRLEKDARRYAPDRRTKSHPDRTERYMSSRLSYR